ncbi:MAG: 4'-phosphopantetheinyl transferase superfamily protein, partial [Myxococcota bacterium]|nr:4'-phosphopantetheinyl transferase superfamily protein [Myxococcota bacterium]
MTPPPLSQADRPSTLPNDEAHIYWAQPDTLDQARQTQLVSWLCEDERRSYEALKIPADRQAYLAAHVLLRQSLSDHSNRAAPSWTFARLKSGRPILADECTKQGLSFNISHSRGLVACIVSRQTECGIDVESLDPTGDAQDVAARFFTPAERDQLFRTVGIARDTLFKSLWTLKEA